MSNGLDFSVWRPGADWIKQNGFQFAVRYLSWLPNSKVIDKAEFDSYRAAGIDVVLNWEWDTTDMLGGAASGQAHATEARRQAEALGAWPCVIYFSCDQDVTEAQQGAINAYLAAAGQVLGGPQHVGIYGGYWPVKRAMEAGVAEYGWQTYAWSGGLWYGPAQLRQVPGGNGNWDADTAVSSAFGQVGASTTGGTPMAGTVDQDWLNTGTAYGQPDFPRTVKATLETAQALYNVLQQVLSNQQAVGAVKAELDTIKATIEAAGGHPADAPILAAVAKAQASVDAIGSKLAKAGQDLA